MGRHIKETPKRHILGQKDVIWRIDRQNRCTSATCARDEETKKRQRKKPNSGKLAIRRDHPRCRIEMKSCMVGGLQMVVLSFEFHQNRLRGVSKLWGVEICPSPLTWPLAYTTACTTVQAVIPLERQLIALQLSCWQFLYNETLQQTSRPSLSTLYERRQI